MNSTEKIHYFLHLSTKTWLLLIEQGYLLLLLLQ